MTSFGTRFNKHDIELLGLLLSFLQSYSSIDKHEPIELDR